MKQNRHPEDILNQANRLAISVAKSGVPKEAVKFRVTEEEMAQVIVYKNNKNHPFKRDMENYTKPLESCYGIKFEIVEEPLERRIAARVLEIEKNK